MGTVILNQKKSQFYIIAFTIAVLLHLIAVFFSSGFHHGDEHYQIIGFAGHLLGTHENNDIAWEFGVQLRPTLHAYITYILITLSKAFNIENPYTQTSILRAITAIFSLLSINYFLTYWTRKYNSNHEIKLLIILSLFIWFMPYLNVRYSSEIWARNTFIIGLIYTLNILNKGSVVKFFLSGILLGFSFLFRFQMGFMIMGLIGWLVFIYKTQHKNTIIILIGTFTACLIGIVLDSFYYGVPTLSFWNYFDYNILRGVASGFGTQPWWKYFFMIFNNAIWPIGIVILVSVLILTIKQPKNILVWLFWSFTFIHIITPHKELRFLFPLTIFIPAIILDAYTLMKIKTSRAILIGLLLINFFGLFIIITKPAGIGRAKITKYIYDTYNTKLVDIYSFKEHNPYWPWKIPMKFYLTQNIKEHSLEKINNLSDLKYSNDRVLLIIVPKEYFESNYESLNSLGFEYKSQSISNFVQLLNQNIWFENKRITYLLEKKP